MSVSIVTPSYNQAAFLESTLSSVVEQEYSDIEYIVLDGGSDDGSQEIIEQYADDVAFWRSASDDGQAAAIDEGFRRSSGEILGWVNSDDILLPGAVEAVVSHFEQNPDEHVIAGNSFRIDAEGRRLKRIYSCSLDHRAILFWGTGFDQPASFWRREAYFEAGGIDTDKRFCFDYDLFLRMSRECDIVGVDSFLAALRLHGESKTATMADVQRREKKKIRRKHGYYDAGLPRRWWWRAYHAARFRVAQLTQNSL